MSLKRKMLSKENWAIYGISPDAEKFGYKIPQIMKENGYKLFGINKKYANQEILGIKVYASLEEVPEDIDCIDVIVNPKISMTVIDEAVKKGVKYIWFQPHTYDDEVIEKLKETDIEYVDDDCVYKILRVE